MIVRARSDDVAVVVHLAGEIDMVTAPAIRAALDEALATAAGRALVVDLGETTFCGSHGLHLLEDTALTVRAREPGAVLHVVTTRRNHLRLFALLGLSELLRTGPTVREALGL